MATLQRNLNREQIMHPQDVGLRMVRERLTALFGRAEIEVAHHPQTDRKQQHSYLHVLAEGREALVAPLRRGFHQLLKLGALEPAYISGSLFVVPIQDRKISEQFHMRRWGEIDHLTEELERILGGMAANEETYREAVRQGLTKALELVRQLRKEEVSRSQRFAETQERPDLYYAIPWFALLAGPTFAAYFASGDEAAADNPFRDVLAAYARHLYPADGIRPIGLIYATFPFIVFQSFALPDVRAKLMRASHLLSSNELNVLSLMLAK